MFHRIPVPTPFEIGRVNAYVAGRTIVDPGPNSDQSWEELVEELDALGLAPDDIERVVITHPHIDHFGLGGRFKERGAEIVTSPPAAELVADYPGHLDRQQAYFEPFLERCGVESNIAETVVQLPEAFVDFADSYETDRVISAGDSISIADKSFDVRRAAGHAPGELVFAYEFDGERRAVVGDNVLGHVSPNPFLQPPREEGGDLPRLLVEFNDSLERLRDADFDRLLPGHGDPVENPKERITALLDEHEERNSEVRELVTGPTQPVDVLEGLFGDMALTEMFLGMSEAIGHLDLLVHRDQLVREETDEELVYRPTE